MVLAIFRSSISEEDNFSIEDLFTHDDFNSFVIDKPKNNDKNVSNSKFLKDQEIDKVLLVKKFLDQVKKNKSKVKLSQTTINNFKVIFEKIGVFF